MLLSQAATSCLLHVPHCFGEQTLLFIYRTWIANTHSFIMFIVLYTVPTFSPAPERYTNKKETNAYVCKYKCQYTYLTSAGADSSAKASTPTKQAIITITPPQHLLLLLCTADSYRMAFCITLQVRGSAFSSSPSSTIAFLMTTSKSFAAF